MNSLMRAVDRAWKENRRFTDWSHIYPSQKEPADFESLIKVLPDVFHAFDDFLWNGQLFAYMRDNDVDFRISGVENGPAGLTTYDHTNGMQVLLNRNAWAQHFPAMVGGELCNRSALCLSEVFAHECIHVLLFSVYLSVQFPFSKIQQLPTVYDVHHNCLFVVLLKTFFGQDTIDNSLLLRANDASFPLTFDKPVLEIESQCLPRCDGGNASTSLRVWHEGQWKPAQFGRHDGYHHSVVTTVNDKRRLLVPNGLLNC